ELATDLSAPDIEGIYESQCKFTYADDCLSALKSDSGSQPLWFVMRYVYKGILLTNLSLMRVEREGYESFSSIESDNFTCDVRVDTDPRQDLSHLTSSIPSLQEFPLVCLPYSDSNAQHNVLDWQRHAARRMIQHYLEVDMFYQTQLELAQYFHVPVGNVQSDPTLFAGDLFYARHLQKHNHLLWMSPTDRPDLGGKEDDDNRSAISASGELRHVPAISKLFCQPQQLIASAQAFKPISLSLPASCNTLSNQQIMVPGLAGLFAAPNIACQKYFTSAHINDFEGGSVTGISFDSMPQASLEELVQGGPSVAFQFDYLR
ncbi:hypothetical protein OS493_028702, partial [Desmophyllum pertusum]